MKDFEYYAPDSLNHALSLMERHSGSAMVLAGGTDLIVQMKRGRAHPDVLVDVKKIPDLARLEWDEEGGLFLGAAVPLARIAVFAPLASRYGFLRDACSSIGSLQLRSRGTMGGNICNGAPSADSAPPLLCLAARAVVARLGATRVLPLADFFAGPGKTTLAPDELLVGLEIPPPPLHSSGSYLRHIPRQEMDIAAAGVAAFLVLSPENGLCRDARIALAAVAPTPIRVPEAEAILLGTSLTADVIERAAACAAAAAHPISDMRGSAEYRRELVRVLTKRAIATASNGIRLVEASGAE